MRLALALALVAVGLILAPGGESAQTKLVAASGDWALSDSRAGEAIFGTENLGPGHAATGSVTIANVGSERGRLVLTALAVNGALADALRLTVRDGVGAVVYDGPLAPTSAQPLAVLNPNERATYAFSAALPRELGDAYQGTEAVVGYRWTMTEAPPEEPSTVAPTPPPNIDAPPTVSPPDTPLARYKRTRCTITGTRGPDRLRGTRRADIICGGGGNDLLVGRAGNDILFGGSGRDRIRGGVGNDLLVGGGGKDRLDGGRGDDWLDGGWGRDRLAGGVGKDRLSGGPGSDRLAGGANKDRLAGGPGRDRLTDGAGKDRPRGGAGRDWLDGRRER